MIIDFSEITTVSLHAHIQEGAVYCAAFQTRLSKPNALIKQSKRHQVCVKCALNFHLILISDAG